jgi:hypothetical protein
MVFECSLPSGGAQDSSVWLLDEISSEVTCKVASEGCHGNLSHYYGPNLCLFEQTQLCLKRENMQTHPTCLGTS